MNRIIVLIVFLGTIACDSSGPKSTLGPPVEPTKKLNVALVLRDSVFNTEMIAPLDIFHRTEYYGTKGMNVFLVSPKPDTIRTFEGIRILPDFTFTSTDLPEIDILIVPGSARSFDSDLRDRLFIQFVRENAIKALHTISLGDGAFILAQTGLLKTYHCTTYPGSIPRFREVFSDLRVIENVSFVHDRKFLTSVGGVKSSEVSLYLVELMYGKAVADSVANDLTINWDLKLIKHWRE